MIGRLVGLRTTWAICGSLPFRYFVFKVSNGTTTSDMLGVEDLVRLWPRCICTTKGIPVNEVEVITRQLGPSSEEIACKITPVSVVDGVCWGADNLLPTKEDTRVLEGEFTADVVASSDCPPQPLLGKLVHVDVEFFNKA